MSRPVWDADAKVFYAMSNIPGLNVEAPTVADFIQVVKDLAPDPGRQRAGAGTRRPLQSAWRPSSTPRRPEPCPRISIARSRRG